jgi:hypothetical protein
MRIEWHLSNDAFVLRPQHDDALGLTDAERSQKYGVDDTEHGRTGADTERERPDRDRCESR